MFDPGKLQAYELIKKEELPDVLSTGWLLRHKKSGARIALMENKDENKVFNIAFRTTPSNSTGVAHIMEHCVLCGSRKYPAKDPFIELVKGSMNTFLNAMTYPDKTMYPVASCNDRDFANLMSVYMDAVFYPNIYTRKEIFKQEGWHCELDAPEGELTYNGVVFNEMKGAFSSPDEVVEREIMQKLFPDTTYHHESGGDPECIPDLTYEEFLEFHRTYYHPSNSYIYLYGDMDFNERLEWLDREYLSDFEQISVDSKVTMQEPFKEKLVCETEYPVGDEDPIEKNAYLTWSAVVGTSLDTKLSNAFAVLEYVLLEMPGAPLKEALLEEELGSDIMSSYDSGTLQPGFSVIAKGADEADIARFDEVIRKTLEKVAKEGLDKDALKAAINLMEFRFREADYGTFPKGLMYGVDMFDSWLYDDEKPFDYLWSLRDYDFLKSQIGTGYYEDLVRTWLLENPHCLLLAAKPVRSLTKKMQEREAARLVAYRETLDEEQILDLINETKALHEYQETPSSKEDLEKIPMLEIGDLNKTIRKFSNEIHPWENALMVRHNFETNGIAYIDLMFDAAGVPQEDLVWLGLLRTMVGSVDTASYSYSQLSTAVGSRTGGIAPLISIYPDFLDPVKASLAFGLRCRTLTEEIPFCFEIMEEMLFTSDLAQEKRLRELLFKLRSRLGTALASSGNATAVTRCMASFSANSQISDRIGGIAFYDFIKDLTDHFDEKKPLMAQKLSETLTRVLSGKILISYTGSADHLETIRTGTKHLTARCSRENEELFSGTDLTSYFKQYPLTFPDPVNEALRTPGQVQYVARCGNFRKNGGTYHGSMTVLRTIMSFDYLWNNVRVTGGAYGCGGNLLRNGDTSFSSFRDPNLRRTDEVFRGIPEYLDSFDADERDMTKYIIGTVSTIDTPLTPSALGTLSMLTALDGRTDELRQQTRDQILTTTAADIRALAEPVRAALKDSHLCVVGSAAGIEADRDLFDTVREL